MKTAPTVEPITVAELKTFARIDTDSEDTLLTDFIQAAREGAENYLARSLLEQTLIFSFDFWFADSITLPRPPLMSVTEVRTLLESGSTTSYASSNYYVLNTGAKTEIVLRQDSEFPINENRDRGGFEVEYQAGYGSAASSIPSAIRQAIKLWATTLYEKRGLESNEPPLEAKTLLESYRIMQL